MKKMKKTTKKEEQSIESIKTEHSESKYKKD